jgi:hypothetical protein
MTPEIWIAIGTISGTVAAVGVPMLVGTIKFSNRLTELNVSLTSLTAVVKAVSEGDTAAHRGVVKDIERQSGVLVEHEAKIDKLTDCANDHETRIVNLENFGTRIGRAHERQHGEVVM